jgi:hypothetical protein
MWFAIEGEKAAYWLLFYCRFNVSIVNVAPFTYSVTSSSVRRRSQTGSRTKMTIIVFNI